MEPEQEQPDATQQRLQALRAKAEQRQRLVTTAVEAKSPQEVRRLVQELQMHQVELEMQYEELLQAQADSEYLRRQYVDLYDFAPVGYCTLGPDGRVQQLNLRAARLLGRERGALLGRPFALQVQPSGREDFLRFLEQVLAAETPRHCELLLLRADGSSFLARLEGVRLPVQEGAYACRVVLTDDTQRHRVQQQLAASEQRFRTLFEESQDAVCLVKNGRYVDCNRAALLLLGAHDKSQIIGQGIDLLTPELQPNGRRSADMQREIMLLLQRQGSARVEWLRHRFSGEALWLELVLTVISVEGEELIHVVWRDITARKRADQALAASEARFRTIFEQSADGMLLLQDGRYVACNRAALAIIGAEREEQLVGQPASTRAAAVQPDGRDTVEWFQHNVERALREGSVRCEALMQRFTGEDIWVEAVLTPVSLPGLPTLTHIGWRDVTERRRSRQLLEESEARLRTALDAASLGVGEFDLVQQQVHLDERARAIYGLTAADMPLSFARISGLQHPDSLPASQDMLRRAVEEGVPVDIEELIVRPDGEQRYVHANGRVLRDAQGQPTRMVGVLRDVTERRRAEQLLRESEARLQTAVEAADMGIGSWDLGTRLFSVDGRGRRMFGLPAEGPDLTFEALLALVHPQDRELAATSLQRAASGTAPLDVEVRVVHPDGTVRYLAANGRLIGSETRGAARMSGVLRDVTERRLAEQRLRESEEQLRTALSAANMGVGLWQPSTAEVVVDARTAEIMGLAGPGSYTAPDFSQRLHPEDLPEVVERIRLSLESRLAFSLHVRLRRVPEVDWRYVRLSRQALYDDHGQPSRVAGVVRDITEFRLANLRLRESEERLRLALKSSHTGVFEWNYGSDELFWDERAQLIFGQPSDTGRLTFDAIRRRVHPADEAYVTEALTHTLRTGEPFELEHRIVWADGTVRYVAASGQVRHDAAGRPERLAGLVRDVTERRLAQEELGYKTRLLNHILSTIPVVLSRVAPDGTLQEVSGPGLRRLGVPDNVLVGRNVFEAWPELTPHVQRLLAGEEVQFVGEPPVRSGEQVYFQNYGFYDEERQSGVLFAIDVTETHQANARLAADAAFLQGLVSNIQEGIMAFDTELRVTEWNYLMEQYLKVPRAALVGQPVFEAIPLVNTPLHRRLLQRVLAGEVLTEYNLPFSARPGAFDLAMMPLRDAQGAVVGALGVVRDVTERNRLMEEATQARLQREKEVLSAIMHTQEDERKRIAEALHNGVGQLLYAAKLHLYNQPVDEAHRRAALELLNEGIKATRTISFELTPNILEDFGLKTALEELCKRIPKQNLAVHLSVGELEPGLPRLLETAVYRILQELLNNVIKHAQAREAFVYVEQQPTQLHVSVEDDGRGFDVDAALQKRAGIGLAGIRNRVSLLAGQLSIRSKPGLGTTISIELPLGGEAAETEPPGG